MPSSLVYGKYLICSADKDGNSHVIPNGALYQVDGNIVDIGTTEDLRRRHNPDQEIGSMEPQC